MVERRDRTMLLVTSVRNELARGGPAAESLARALLDVVLTSFTDARRRRVSTIDARIAKTLAALHERMNERWTLARMAKLAGMSRAAFVRRFRQVTGAAPLAYLTHLRIDVARKLLVETDEPASAIAGEVGYRSVYAFSRAFRRLAGVAPSVHRRAARSSLPAIRCSATLRLAA